MKQNPWIQHVKAYALKHKLKYSDALKNNKCKEMYKPVKSVKGNALHMKGGATPSDSGEFPNQEQRDAEVEQIINEELIVYLENLPAQEKSRLDNMTPDDRKDAIEIIKERLRQNEYSENPRFLRNQESISYDQLNKIVDVNKRVMNLARMALEQGLITQNYYYMQYISNLPSIIDLYNPDDAYQLLRKERNKLRRMLNIQGGYPPDYY